MCVVLLLQDYSWFLLVSFFFSSRRRHTRCALVTGGSDVCSSDPPLPRSNAGGTRALTSAGRSLRKAGLRSRNAATASAARTSVARAFFASSDAVQIGRASWRERVCRYVEIAVVGISLNKKTTESIAVRRNLRKSKHTYKPY